MEAPERNVLLDPKEEGCHSLFHNDTGPSRDVSHKPIVEGNAYLVA
jgi:hypothetical protein